MVVGRRDRFRVAEAILQDPSHAEAHRAHLDDQHSRLTPERHPFREVERALLRATLVGLRSHRAPVAPSRVAALVRPLRVRVVARPVAHLPARVGALQWEERDQVPAAVDDARRIDAACRAIPNGVGPLLAGPKFTREVSDRE